MKSIVLSVFLFLPLLRLNAQNKEEIEVIKSKTNVRELLRLSKESEAREKENYAKALKYAARNNWKLKETTTEGGIRELRGITEDLQPIYYETLNLGAGITTRTNYLYSGGGLGLNLHGESMTVGVWDAGAVATGHELLENRAIQKDSPYSIDPHSTHVTGTLIGSDQFDSGNSRGMAFKGNAHCYDWGNPISELSTEAMNGLLISNHSWAATAGSGEYDSQAVSYDNIQFLAPYHLAVFACGNSGGPIDKLYNATKNGLAVAGTFKLPEYLGPSSVKIMTLNGIQFSSAGPSDDGRIKPDIAGVGREVRSSYNTSGTYKYRNLYGTSMASPNVAGSLLLLQQHYTNLYPSTFMKAATLKGLAIHTANEAGPHPGPDINFGWGLLNAREAAETISEMGNTSIIEEDTLFNTQIFSKSVHSGAGPLVATICWTDQPGPVTPNNVSTPTLVRDLDIRITSDGVTYFPWKLDSSNFFGPAILGDNIRDNVEKIEIPNPVQGQSYEITVTHKGTLPAGGQDFSLIVTGVESTPICALNDTITAPTVVLADNNKQAVHNIVALNEVVSGSEAVYHAGDEVKMIDGFSALSGSTFRAFIEGCSYHYPARIAYNQRPVVTYETTTGPAELPLKEAIVFPNPTDRAVTVETRTIKDGMLRVKSITGEEVYRRAIKGQKQVTVELGEVGSGIYIIHLEDIDGSSFSKTIVKQ
ncbi:hypothetical protein GCM10023091_19640 [Ravibacter arvi]|uniref:Secreted protein (Por secretion system target) n=1 Tax=Ravibacter arvi TaxID=2051041 RepID=A0ABP8LYH5_9BACT